MTSSSRKTIQKDYQETLENDLSCAICQDIYINPFMLNCSHSFCKFCVYRWLSKQKGCPQCRMIVTFQGENLALRNIINKMVQKASDEFQEARTNSVNQRLKEEEVQAKDGTINFLTKTHSDAPRTSRYRYQQNNSGPDRPIVNDTRSMRTVFPRTTPERTTTATVAIQRPRASASEIRELEEIVEYIVTSGYADDDYDFQMDDSDEQTDFNSADNEEEEEEEEEEDDSLEDNDDDESDESSDESISSSNTLSIVSSDDVNMSVNSDVGVHEITETEDTTESDVDSTDSDEEINADDSDSTNEEVEISDDSSDIENWDNDSTASERSDHWSHGIMTSEGSLNSSTDESYDEIDEEIGSPRLEDSEDEDHHSRLSYATSGTTVNLSPQRDRYSDESTIEYATSSDESL